MGHGKIRIDKTCLNCNYVVENKYCPNCGQENTQTRQSFHYLFTHFVEDLTHYDGSFWKTIKALLFKPGRLTKEYLEGKRKKYVPPVKLYIFISFVAFLLPSLLPEVSIFGEQKKESSIKNESISQNKIENDSLSKRISIEVVDGVKVKTIKELDSVQNSLPENVKISTFEYYLKKNALKLTEQNSRGKFLAKALESFFHTLPKVLFIYMPIFAFFLWLIHDKKKWYYFDCGVFTLHYFSFLLLTITIGILFEWLLTLIYFIDIISILFNFFILGYSFFYFFRSHSNFFGEPKAVSRIKSLTLFIINIILISFISAGLFIYSIWHID